MSVCVCLSVQSRLSNQGDSVISETHFVILFSKFFVVRLLHACSHLCASTLHL